MNMRNHKSKIVNHKSPAFTLIEIVITLTIIAILASGSIYLLKGQIDSAKDTRVDSDLDGANISPDRVVLSWTQSLGDAFSSRLQVARNGSRRFERLGAQVAAFDGYTTLDALLRWDTGRHGELTLGVENLLDRQYITYYSQTLGTNATWFAGRGRTASLAWTRTF